jgi:hypothetical protein
METANGFKKCGYLHTVEFYSAIKKNEIFSFADKCMELEMIMLSEVSQAQEDRGYKFFLICKR